MKFSLCLEMIYPDLDFSKRAVKVRDKGFSAVEFWAWTDKDLNAFNRLVEEGLKIATFSGQRKGSLLDPQDWEVYRAEVEAAISVAKRLGCDRLMLLTQELLPDGSGRPAPSRLGRAEQRASIVRGLKVLAPLAERQEITLLLEPLNIRVDHPGYFLDSGREGFAIIQEVGSPRVRLLYDIYHLEVMQRNSTDVLLTHLPLVGHIHIADVPGRHEPGTGELDFFKILQAVGEQGYPGTVGFEFSPSAGSDEALDRILELRDRLRESGCPVN
jgi:hydroxypyruvate isomerase